MLLTKGKDFVDEVNQTFYQRPDRDKAKEGFDMPSSSNLATEPPPAFKSTVVVKEEPCTSGPPRTTEIFSIPEINFYNQDTHFRVDHSISLRRVWFDLFQAGNGFMLDDLDSSSSSSTNLSDFDG